METRREPEDGFSFAGWLRTGRLIRHDARWGTREVKFNPNHDPKDGRFTFRDGGAGSSAPRPSPAPQHRPKGDGSWDGGGFAGPGGGSFDGGGATGDGYWMNVAEWRDFRSHHPGLDPHMVTPGETLERIAAEHRIAIAKLRELNRLSHGAVVRPGQILALPKGGSTDTDNGGLRSISKNGYGFAVDAEARTHEAKGVLHFGDTTARSKASQRAAGGADRRTTDDGGHFIAARFNGPTNKFNHFAQDANFNRGAYRAIEDRWAKELRAGKHVSVDIVAHYAGTSRRPDSLTVKWSVNGHPRSRRFHNEPKGTKHDR